MSNLLKFSLSEKKMSLMRHILRPICNCQSVRLLGQRKIHAQIIMKNDKTSEGTDPAFEKFKFSESKGFERDISQDFWDPHQKVKHATPLWIHAIFQGSLLLLVYQAFTRQENALEFVIEQSLNGHDYALLQLKVTEERKKFQEKKMLGSSKTG